MSGTVSQKQKSHKDTQETQKPTTPNVGLVQGQVINLHTGLGLQRATSSLQEQK